MGLSGRRLTKVITGGPDGDLGSNEIKQANEAITCIIDGSGVLVDADGLDHIELLRLASARVMSSHFDRSKLGPRGFFVSTTDTDVTLYDGTQIASGLAFRNTAHLSCVPGCTADFFVPCGGRPAAVASENVDAFLYGQGELMRHLRACGYAGVVHRGRPFHRVHLLRVRMQRQPRRLQQQQAAAPAGATRQPCSAGIPSASSTLSRVPISSSPVRQQ